MQTSFEFVVIVVTGRCVFVLQDQSASELRESLRPQALLQAVLVAVSCTTEQSAVHLIGPLSTNHLFQPCTSCLRDVVLPQTTS